MLLLLWFFQCYALRTNFLEKSMLNPIVIIANLSFVFAMRCFIVVKNCVSERKESLFSLPNVKFLSKGAYCKTVLWLLFEK